MHTMLLGTIILLFHSGFAFDLPRDGCFSDLKVDNDHFNLSNTYHVGDVYPTDAHYDVYGNLFYVESGRNEDGFYFNIKVIKFKTTTAQKIEGLPKGLSYSIAIDNNNTKVLFGTARGIYTYNYETHSATSVSKSDLKLDLIFIDKDSNTYITEHNGGVEELYRLEGDKKIKINRIQSLNELAIDDQNNFYYIFGEQLYILKSDESKPKDVGRVPYYDGLAQIAIHKEKVYVASNNLTYFDINGNKPSLRQVNNIPGKVTAIAFEHSGDFVLGVRGKILKYKKNDCHLRPNQPTTLNN